MKKLGNTETKLKKSAAYKKGVYLTRLKKKAISIFHSKGDAFNVIIFVRII